MLGVMMVGAIVLGADVKRFAGAFTLVFFLSYLCWMAGHFARIAATPDKLQQYGITWSLNLTGEAGFIVTLILGLIVGNFIPGLAKTMHEALRPELYIKIADEMQKMEYEPLLPVEKKLIDFRLALGIILLGLLIFISYEFFPG